MYGRLASHERLAQTAGQMRRQEELSAQVVAGRKVPRTHPPDGEAVAAAAERKMAAQGPEGTSQRRCNYKDHSRRHLA